MKPQHRPDILTCLANLSSDEVFTPPRTANAMLDLLPKKIWKNPELKWLNPACKSGAILREIAARLMVGLKDWEPVEEKRREHILKNMLFGIAITEICALLTRRSLYCSAHANGTKSNCRFKTDEGNIFFEPIAHTFKKGACTYCGAPEKVEYVDEVAQEIHAYHFIHDQLPERIKNMKFDVIVTNPPYQLKDGGHGASARPIYHEFVLKAKSMAGHVVMITPSRWFAGGKGLDDFRKGMREDKSLKSLVDIPNSEEVFPGVSIAGGVCYFHRDSQHKGLCNFNGIKRDLNEFDVVIRDAKAISILKKVLGKASHFFSETVSSRKPFGLPTNFTDFCKEGTETYPCLTKDGIRHVKKAKVTQGKTMLGKWKAMTCRAGGDAGGMPRGETLRVIGGVGVVPMEKEVVCLETFLVIGTFNTKKECENCCEGMMTKLMRFLLSLRMSSQQISKETFSWVPQMDWKIRWTDEMLYRHFGLTKEEIETVEGTIR